MKNYISAGEALRDCQNPFIAFIEETASDAPMELSAFRDKVNNLTLVTNRSAAISPQSGEKMVGVPDANRTLSKAEVAALEDTCDAMQCAACKRIAMVETELSFTLAGEDLACPACGADTQFNYVAEDTTEQADDGDHEFRGDTMDSTDLDAGGDSMDTGGALTFATIDDVLAYQFTGDDESDAPAYDAIEEFILGGAPMADKVRALGHMMGAMGAGETPTEADVQEFISEATAYRAEFASADGHRFAVEFIANKYEVADDMTVNVEDEAVLKPGEAVVDPVVDPVAADVVDPALATTDADTLVTDPNAIVAPTADVDVITDADINATGSTDDATGGYAAADGDDALSLGDAGGDGTTVTLDEDLESLDSSAFGDEPFGEEENVTTVTVASLIDLSRPLQFVKLPSTEIAVFVGSHHIGTLNRTRSTETAAVLYTNNKLVTAFTQVFNKHRDNFETASELAQYGFAPVKFRIALDTVAAKKIADAKETASAQVAVEVARKVNRQVKVSNLALVGICKGHFKVDTKLVTETASLLERAGVPNAKVKVRELFARNGAAFFSAVQKKAGELATKTDEHLNGVTEAVSNAEFIGKDEDTVPAKPVKLTPTADLIDITGETASDNSGKDNSSTGKFDRLVRSVSRR